MAHGAGPWTAMVAVAALAMWSGAAPAQDAIAARTLRAGIVLTDDDLRADGAAAEALAATLVGLETRRAIYAGRPVVEADLRPPTIVRRNAVVTMLYRDGALAISADGRALDSGGEGETVRVINLTSRQPVKGIVTGQGVVEVRQ
jgi:flagella basal body P-ring formation protein FlgA